MAVARLVIPNGYPDIFSNSIFLTAAYLRPPLFDGKAPLEVQYATFGTMVGHEFTHVLDNHQYDRFGQTHELWSAADTKMHDAQVGCVRDQASQFVAPDGAHIDADLVLDESLADFGGTVHAYAALSRELGIRMQERDSDGLTRAQRFFITYAQSWCNAERPELATQRNRGDHHAINRFRVNAPLSNMPEFAAAFACKKDAPMVKVGTARCVVW